MASALDNVDADTDPKSDANILTMSSLYASKIPCKYYANSMSSSSIMKTNNWLYVCKLQVLYLKYLITINYEC